MITNTNRVWINAFGNLFARGFNFFYPTRIAPFGRIRERSVQQPPHIAAHLQTALAISQPKFAKELFRANAPQQNCIFVVLKKALNAN
jgi:hypothetical protein